MSPFVKQVVIFVIIYLVIAAALFFGISFYKNSLAAIVSKIRDNSVLLLSQQAQSEGLTVLREQEIAAKKYSDIFNKIFPYEDDLLDFPRFWQDLVRKKGLTSSFSFSATDVRPLSLEPGYKTYSSSLNGSYQNIINFLSDISQSNFLITVDTIDLLVSGNEFRVNLTGRIFYR